MDDLIDFALENDIDVFPTDSKKDILSKLEKVGLKFQSFDYEVDYKIGFGFVIRLLLELFTFTFKQKIERNDNELDIERDFNNHAEMIGDSQKVKKDPGFLYGKKLLEMFAQDEDILLLDKRLVELQVINTSGINDDPRSHGSGEGFDRAKKISALDYKLWNKYGGKYEIKNKNGITVKDLVTAVFFAKGSKFDIWYELFNDVERVKFRDLPKGKKRLELTINFGFGS